MQNEVIALDLGDSTSLMITALVPEKHAKDDAYEDVSAINWTKEKHKLDELVGGISSFASKVKGAIVAASPDEGSVEFQVSATVKEGKLVALICGGDFSGSFKVTLTWKKTQMQGSQSGA